MRWRYATALLVMMVVAGLLVPEVGASPTGRHPVSGPGLKGLPVAVRGQVSALLAGAETTNPFHQQGPKLTPNNENNTGAGGLFGDSVAVSADGSTLLVGGSGDDDGDGAAWVFVRSGATWKQQAKLTTSNQGEGCDENTGSSFGWSVALSGDGNTALIGAPRYCTYDSQTGDTLLSGVAWVFVRSGTKWTQQGPMLTPNDEATNYDLAEFGTRVAISADGNTALIGAPADSNGTTYGGAVWVFVRSGSTWTQQGARLAASDEGLYTGFGNSIALSADGTTALISGGDGNTTAQAWVFVRSRTTWSQQAVLTSDAHYEGAEALSSNGNTAIITGPTGTAGSLGAAWVFVRSGSTWKQQGPRLMGSGETSKSGFGRPVLSGDGNTAVFMGSGANEAWVFARNGTTWKQQGSVLTGKGEVNTPYSAGFGYAAAMSNDGSTVLIGGQYDHDDAGAVWPFVRCTYSSQATGAGRYVAASADTNECPVKVWVDPVENPVKSGFHPEHDGAKATPAFLTGGADPVRGGETITDKCGSGCENVAITVTPPEASSANDPDHPGIGGVKVTAAIGDATPSDAEYPYPRIMRKYYISGAPSPVLCLIDPTDGTQIDHSCGSTVTDTTDDHGKIYVRVWFPGVVHDAKFLLSATAEKCNQGTCTQVGKGETNLTLRPNIVFKQRAWLSDKDAQALVDFYRHKLISDDFSWLEYLPAGKAGGLIKFLKDHYGDYQKLSAGSDLLAVSILMGNLDLKPEGLLANTAGGLIPHGSLLYGDSFFAAMVGVAKDYGAFLESVPSNYSGRGKRQRMAFAIYELSMCVHTRACNNPEIGAAPGPYLGLWLWSAKDDSELDKAAASVKVFTPNQAVTYEARDWFASQF